jgi:small nuclear ribonucleoprotein (snRNP)-like protein
MMTSRTALVESGIAEKPAARPGGDMLEEMIGLKVVVDLRDRYVCLGTLQRIDAHHLELRNADLHDLRDADTTRELYVAESRATGVKRNRKRVLLVRSEVIAVSRLEDVVDE